MSLAFSRCVCGLLAPRLVSPLLADWVQETEAAGRLVAGLSLIRCWFQALRVTMAAISAEVKASMCIHYWHRPDYCVQSRLHGGTEAKYASLGTWVQ